MDELISRQAAIDAVANCTDILVTNLPTMIYKTDAQKAICELPSAQLIRCKDCAKREYCRTSNTWAVPPNDDWFCADAERRD